MYCESLKNQGMKLMYKISAKGLSMASNSKRTMRQGILIKGNFSFGTMLSREQTTRYSDQIGLITANMYSVMTGMYQFPRVSWCCIKKSVSVLIRWPKVQYIYYNKKTAWMQEVKLVQVKWHKVFKCIKSFGHYRD